ncbi:MAG: methylmalonyl-CoA epimerase [Candidatus Marinimicrobia bacterium]|nr:methylmalonyl-CoA epimerase [Candidatus Neomarinimicrobiota bacterium]|tara:strand:- start:485 stop:898 length:414 start_codon:yes stop_codon:yes gene_type:complete
MKIIGIEHIGIAVKDLKTDAPFWKHILGIDHTHSEKVEAEGVLTDIYDTGKGKVELLESLHPDSPVKKFLEDRGPGIHHVCFEVDDIYTSIKELKENNIRVIGEKYRIGVEGYKVVFIHPKSTGGILVELAEKPANS